MQFGLVFFTMFHVLGVIVCEIKSSHPKGETHHDTHAYALSSVYIFRFLGGVLGYRKRKLLIAYRIRFLLFCTVLIMQRVEMYVEWKKYYE